MLGKLTGSLILFFALSVGTAHAAALTGLEDVMNNQLSSNVSDHQIRFTTPTGVDASGDTITITFQSTFALGSVDFSDIDLFHGPVTGLETSETLAAAPAAGVWGVSIASRTITFTAPTDAAAGEITGGDIVTVRIGTNAVGGTDQITNPTSNGNYQINIAGTFGDVGGITVNIFDTHAVSFSAVVGTPPPPGPGPVAPPPTGGGGPPGVDGTPPVISNVRAINITQTTAEIVWDTDENADSQTTYGITVAYENGSLFNPALVLSHSIPLSGLTPDTLYHFYVTSKDAVGNSASSPDFTFRTLPPARAPFISNIRVVAITDSSAIVLWDTDIPASSLVDFGLTGAYGSSASTPGFVTNHAVALTGLTPSTLYHFRVTSAEPGGLFAVSGDNTFTTLGDISPPANVFSFTATPGDEENFLEWINPPDPDFSHVVIRARTDHYPVDPSDGRLVYVGSGELFVDSGLVNGTTYYYGNFAHDASGNAASGAFAQATPSGLLPPLPPPVPPIPPPVPPGPGPTLPPTPPGGPGGSTTTPPTPGPGGATTTPPVVTPPSPPGVQPRIQAFYFAGSGQIPLLPTPQGTVIAAAGRTVLIQIPTSGFTTAPVSGTLRIGSSVYALTPLPGQATMGATFVPSYVPGFVEAIYELQFEDGSSQAGRNMIDVRSGGQVVEEQLLAGREPVPGATVTLFDAETGLLWNGAAYGQANPVKTDEDGGYVFVVPNGEYLIQVTKDLYITQERRVNVTDHIVAEIIMLPRIVPIPFIGGFLESLQTQTAKDAANVLAIAAIAAVLANLLSAASLVSLLYYLWFLFTQPILLLGKKKRKQWGLVYNALSKEPVDLVAVRLQELESGRVIQTRVTGRDGRFIFKAKKGNYIITVSKNGHTFPTEYLKNAKEDGELVDIYHGEKIEVTEDGSILAVNIPIDPVTEEAPSKKVLFQRFLRRLQHAIAILGPLVTLFAFIISPSIWMAGILVFQIATYLLFRRLAKPKKAKGWGVVYDRKSRNPLGRAVVRIFDKKFNKLLETQVTGPAGTYGFFASNNTYFITVERPGYEKYRSEDIDLTDEKEKAVIDRHIPLKHVRS